MKAIFQLLSTVIGNEIVKLLLKVDNKIIYFTRDHEKHICANYLYIFDSHMKIISERSKRRNFLSLVFIIKSLIKVKGQYSSCKPRAKVFRDQPV